MNYRILLTACCVSLISFSVLIAEDTASNNGTSSTGAPANSELVVDQSFDSDSLDSKWHINTGTWAVKDGVLKVSEVAADKHAAAARFPVETNNAVYQLRFRLLDDAKGFHLGFDPAPGELDKKGHLFSVIVTPSAWKIMKHVDKKNPKQDPNEVLANESMSFEKGRWYTLRLTTWETYVTATIDGDATLKANHPTFGVKKPTLVFRCQGDGVELDDIKVWRQVK